MDITKYDKNFKVDTTIDKSDIKFYNAEEAPMRLYGVFREGNGFVRLPGEIASATSEGVAALNNHSAGGRVRFCTDSPYVAVHADMGEAMLGSSERTRGFDIYVRENGKEAFAGLFRSDAGNVNGIFENVIDFGSKEMREITINFPLYRQTKELYIGLSDTATVTAHPDYTYEKPIVYYGSSITQGGCASRAGLSYQGIISREIDTNFVNLGFSGSAKGEDAIREYMKNLDMSIFVLDYDFNAPTPEHLEKTHLPIYKAIREAQPTLPIIMASRPNPRIPDDDKREKIIHATYEYAIGNGDKNVYFISGKDLMKISGNDGTADGVHPNDFGFYSMAQGFLPIIKEILGIK